MIILSSFVTINCCNSQQLMNSNARWVYQPSGVFSLVYTDVLNLVALLPDEGGCVSLRLKYPLQKSSCIWLPHNLHILSFLETRSYFRSEMPFSLVSLVHPRGLTNPEDGNTDTEHSLI